MPATHYKVLYYFILEENLILNNQVFYTPVTIVYKEWYLAFYEHVMFDIHFSLQDYLHVR